VGSSVHSSYDDLPELLHVQPPFSLLIAAAPPPTAAEPSLHEAPAALRAPGASDGCAPASPADTRHTSLAHLKDGFHLLEELFLTGPSSAESDFLRTTTTLEDLKVQRSSLDSFEATDSWTLVALHLAGGKWPAPQMLPLMVWCLALFILAL
jgi:hypothetical protein